MNALQLFLFRSPAALCLRGNCYRDVEMFKWRVLAFRRLGDSTRDGGGIVGALMLCCTYYCRPQTNLVLLRLRLLLLLLLGRMLLLQPLASVTGSPHTNSPPFNTWIYYVEIRVFLKGWLQICQDLGTDSSTQYCCYCCYCCYYS